MLNLSVLLEDSARKYQSKDAFIFMDKSFSFSQINAAANQIANGLLAKGIGKGDKVALNCLNLPYFPMVYFGILKVGAIVVPLSVLLKQEEVAYHLINSEAKAYFCFEGTPQLHMAKDGYAGFMKATECTHFFTIMADPSAPSLIEGTQTLGQLMAGQSVSFSTVSTQAEDTAVIIYTSGTTGRPKGAELTHSNLLLNAILANRLFDCKPTDTQLIVLPLFHIFAMTTLMNSGLYCGAKSILLPRFDPEEVFGLMEKHEVTIFAGVPTMYWGLLNYKGKEFDYDQISKKLNTAISGGASLPVKVLEDFKTRFNLNIIEGYGMSESSPIVTFNQIDVGLKAGSIGTPVWGVEVKIVDDNDKEVPIGDKGQLIFKGHNVMKGYYKNPEANAKALKDGWMHSGDVGIKDEDGFFYIVDRTKDMIIRGGLNVYPREVEEVMMKHEAISLVAVIGIPDEKMGEDIKAFVVLKDGAITTEQDVKDWTKSQIASYKYPRIVEFVDSLPMSATGKILKKELRKNTSQ